MSESNKIFLTRVYLGFLYGIADFIRKHIQWFPLSIVFVWIFQASYAILTNGYLATFRMFGLDMFSHYFQLGSGTLHASTALIGFGLLILTYVLLKNIPIHSRFVIACAIPVFGLLFYDFVHICFDFMIIGRGMPLIQLSLVGICYLILHFYNLKYKFLHFDSELFFVLGATFIFVLIVFVNSGFFQNLYLYGTSAHNELWLLTKFLSVWMWSGLLINWRRKK